MSFHYITFPQLLPTIVAVLRLYSLTSHSLASLYNTQAYADPIFSMSHGNHRRQHNNVTTPTEEPLLTDEWEVPQGEIIVESSLGEGAFGEVYKGILKGPIVCSKVRPSQRKAIFTEVAIKLLKSELGGGRGGGKEGVREGGREGFDYNIQTFHSLR